MIGGDAFYYRVDADVQDAPPSEAAAASRLLVQGSFGPTSSDIAAALALAARDPDAASDDDDLAVAAAWVESQMAKNATLLRAHFRQRANPRFFCTSSKLKLKPQPALNRHTHLASCYLLPMSANSRSSCVGGCHLRISCVLVLIGAAVHLPTPNPSARPPTLIIQGTLPSEAGPGPATTAHASTITRSTSLMSAGSSRCTRTRLWRPLSSRAPRA